MTLRVLLLAALLVSACASSQRQTSRPASEPPQPTPAQSVDTDAPAWKVNCIVDQVKATRTCFANTFGFFVFADGTPYSTSRNAPLRIWYVDSLGPFVNVGFHTHRTKPQIIRLDEGSPITLPNGKPQPELMAQLRAAKSLRGRSYQWPNGEMDAAVALDGIGEALDQLDRERKR